MNKALIFTLLSTVVGVSSWSSAATAELNLALGKPATASSSERGALSAEQAVDGAANTRWSSDFNDHNWIMVDLQGRYDLSQVKLHWQNSYSKDYEVQISDNGNDWTSVKSVVNGNGGLDDHTISGQARYVRVEGSRRATKWGHSLWEFEVYGSAITENISQGKPAVASSEERGTLSAAKAVDGIANSRWSSDFKDNNWIYVDLGDKHQITQVKLHWQNSYSKDYKIQTSNDASRWETIRTVTNSDGGLDDLSLDGHGRYLRVEGTKRATNWGHSLWELEVYGYAASLPGRGSDDSPVNGGGTDDPEDHNDDGNDDSGSDGGGSDDEGQVDTQAPSVPAQLRASQVGANSLTLAWDTSTDDQGVLSYEVFRNGVLIAELLAPTQVFMDAGLVSGSSYQYTVRASDSAGNWSAKSTSLRVSTVNSMADQPVAGAVTLKWATPDQRENGAYLESYEIAGYEIRYRKVGEPKAKVKLIDDAAATSTSLGLLSGDYEFSVAVYDTNGLYSAFVPLSPVQN